MVIEPVPEILLHDEIPRPVRRLGIDEDDTGAEIALIAVAPDIVIPVR
jgi:hypothetical protein